MNTRKSPRALAVLAATALSLSGAGAKESSKMEATPQFSLVGDWKVRVEGGAVRIGNTIVRLRTPAIVDVAPARIIAVQDEKYDALPLFDDKAPGYVKGAPLRGVQTPELSAPNYLDPQSVVVRLAPGGQVLERGKDYQFDDTWSGIGRLPEQKIGANSSVFISYKHGVGRLDSIVATRAGRVFVKSGQEKAGLPQPPEIGADETRLANIWVFGRLAKLSENNIFPITETAFPAATPATNVEALLPKTLAKLRNSEPLKILAWGDSVTESTYLRPEQKWQQQFVARLQQRFPKAEIELVTQGWGGRTTQNYLDEPPGSPRNYREQVLAVRPDLVISEFVNDAYLSPEQVEAVYGGVLKDFREIGAEWIIQTPHYVLPAWMNLDREKNIDDDPRPYVAGLREFAAKHNVALSDAARRWGRLWRQGTPYTTLMVNMINHPDERGMKLFADALMELFPQK